MPYLDTNGTRLSYERTGHGEDVLLIMGQNAAGHVWDMHQTPALRRAGYRTTTFNNRGIPPSSAPPGSYTLADMAADTRGLIEALGLAPCRIVGTSLGAMIAEELAIQSPALVRSAVLIATRPRADVFRAAQLAADRELAEQGRRLPARYRAADTAQKMLSPATLRNDAVTATWLEILELAAGSGDATGQAGADTGEDRRTALTKIEAPCRVIAFSDDSIAPPHLAAEAAEAIPDCDFVEIADCGHLGYLERPDEVNAAIVEFLGKH
ncbi:alpha/beta fold hydrolase [Actinoplanes sp. NPDC020271]|uniref:alpha/beta fold hydrolase n=1 Tax=Actinoplanes sp. NPDC020271 TaxID=3363896 RepID=UPI0037932B27